MVLNLFYTIFIFPNVPRYTYRDKIFCSQSVILYPLTTPTNQTYHAHLGDVSYFNSLKIEEYFHFKINCHGLTFCQDAE